MSWTYAKGPEGSAGADTAWLDGVGFEPSVEETVEQIPTLPPAMLGLLAVLLLVSARQFRLHALRR